MSNPEPSIRVKVDVTNPGQFFACCGLLELADRLWPGAEGWFEGKSTIFFIQARDYESVSLTELINELRHCDILGLTDQESEERKILEAEKRRLRQEGNELPAKDEQRRKDLGILARSGEITLGSPFSFTLNWWQASDDSDATPKTWAGLQELHRIAQSARAAIPANGPYESLLDFPAILRLTEDYIKKNSDKDTAVEPFYFDARRFAHAHDTGYSLDVQDAETTAHPAIELLTLIGLQRFRPVTVSGKRSFRYTLWTHPLPAFVAAAFTCGAIAKSMSYEFQLLSRDNQNRYKAFDFATPIGDQL